MVKRKKISIIGPPHTRKDVHGYMLAKHHQVPFLSLGDAIREEITKKSPFGKKIEKIVFNGSLLDDDTINNFMLKTISCKNKNDGYVIEGYPRTLNQMKFMNKNFSNPLDLVIVILIDKMESELRAKTRLRHDDLINSVLNNRWQEYVTKSVPVINLYQKNNMVIIIDGNDSIENINNKIINEVDTFIRRL